ncbi:MAG: hypothetical protein ACFFDN_15870 [Candidatus Hodarchaeota archaeon]
MELILKMNNFKFPFISKAFQKLGQTVPDSELSETEELVFVLRAYSGATGQKLTVEKIVRSEENPDYYDALLNRGDSEATRDQMGRKLAGINKFNAWLQDHGLPIRIIPNKLYLDS